MSKLSSQLLITLMWHVIIELSNNDHTPKDDHKTLKKRQLDLTISHKKHFQS
jgi:hypothetical protein